MFKEKEKSYIFRDNPGIIKVIILFMEKWKTEKTDIFRDNLDRFWQLFSNSMLKIELRLRRMPDNVPTDCSIENTTVRYNLGCAEIVGYYLQLENNFKEVDIFQENSFV